MGSSMGPDAVRNPTREPKAETHRHAFHEGDVGFLQASDGANLRRERTKQAIKRSPSIILCTKRLGRKGLVFVFLHLQRNRLDVAPRAKCSGAATFDKNHPARRMYVECY
eukprot:1163775-Pyramimonas_sp.AAC.1